MAKAQPDILTPRPRLRPFRASDARAVAALCRDREIAATTLLIPHPYRLSHAREWIAGHAEQFSSGKRADYAVTLRAEETLVGAVGLRLEPDHRRAELGYWIGKTHWNRGYATEAARAAMGFGFRHYRLHRIYAHHMASNPASGEVLLKLGMRYEGRVRQHIVKWDRYEDVLIYGMLRSEWNGGPETD